MAVVQPVDVAATLSGLAAITAVVVGARATRPRQTAPSPPAPDDDLMDVEALNKVRERVAAQEAILERVERRLDDHDEAIALLRAVEVAIEELHRIIETGHHATIDATPRPRGRGRG